MGVSEEFPKFCSEKEEVCVCVGVGVGGCISNITITERFLAGLSCEAGESAGALWNE